MAEEPFGSHQSAAIAPKWAASFGSMVVGSVMVQSVTPDRGLERPCTQRGDRRRVSRAGGSPGGAGARRREFPRKGLEQPGGAPARTLSFDRRHRKIGFDPRHLVGAVATQA